MPAGCLIVREPLEKITIANRCIAHNDNPLSNTEYLINIVRQGTIVYFPKNMQQSIGFSEYQLTRQLPEILQSSLPSIEEIEAEIGGIEGE